MASTTRLYVLNPMKVKVLNRQDCHTTFVGTKRVLPSSSTQTAAPHHLARDHPKNLMSMFPPAGCSELGFTRFTCSEQLPHVQKLGISRHSSVHSRLQQNVEPLLACCNTALHIARVAEA